MYVVLAWFCDRPLPAEQMHRSRDRFDADVATLVPDTYVRHDRGGADWGLTVLHARDTGAYRWPVFAEDGGVSAVSMGIPVGLDVTPGPLGLAARLLDGNDVHDGVVPPFGLLALDSARRVVIQQDWLGMCRLFTGRHRGMTAFCSRPSLLARFLHGIVEPDLNGWASYAVTGHFGGEFSPVRGVRLLRPGERVTAQRRPTDGWDLSFTTRHTVADVIAAGISARAQGLTGALDSAAGALTSVTTSLCELYDDDVTIGLSGGKDSRLIAASVLANGRLPRLQTNEDTAAEGETARHLVEILHQKRGLRPAHRMMRAGAPETVLRLGLRERIARMQRLYDYQFPSTFSVRSPGPPHLAATARPALLGGAAGGLATGYCYPRTPTADDLDRANAERVALSQLISPAVVPTVVESALTQERDRIADVLEQGALIGLRGLELVDYAHLVEHVRRWCISAYSVGSVTPFLAPGFVAATFAVSPDEKRRRVLHTELLRRFMPEWLDVPFVTAGTGPAVRTQIWDGDGIEVISDLLDTTHGRVAQLLRRDPVEQALIRCARGDGRAPRRPLQQFAWLAVASHSLEPDRVLTSTGTTYARVAVEAAMPEQPLLQPQLARLARRLRFVKRTRLGRRLWAAARTRALRRRAARTNRTNRDIMHVA